jgi:hypothetical protein
VIVRQVVTDFRDKDDLVDALVTSAHIPYYADGRLLTTFRGRYVSLLLVERAMVARLSRIVVMVNG